MIKCLPEKCYQCYSGLRLILSSFCSSLLFWTKVAGEKNVSEAARAGTAFHGQEALSLHAHLFARTRNPKVIRKASKKHTCREEKGIPRSEGLSSEICTVTHQNTRKKEKEGREPSLGRRIQHTSGFTYTDSLLDLSYCWYVSVAYKHGKGC